MNKIINFFLIFAVSLFFINIAEAAERKIVINLPGRSLALYEGDKKIRLYPIAIGKPSTPTPIGYYKISSKDVNPTWTDPSNYKNTIPSGPSNPLGYRWMQIYGNYGIHGTNNPNSIGNYVSNGCIRMFEANVEELFDLVQVGTPVEITYNRVVVEKTPEDVVAFYVYPDNYNRQALTVDMIKNWLKGYGVEDFISDEDILAKIQASDGTPAFVAKSNPIVLNGEKLKEKAVQADGAMYLPLNTIAGKLDEKYNWNSASSVISTSFAEAKGVVKNNHVYIDARDLDDLFRVKGELSKDNVFVIGNYTNKDGNKKIIPPSSTNNANNKEEKPKEQPVKTEEPKKVANNTVVNTDNSKNKDKKDTTISENKNTEVKKDVSKPIKKKGKPVIVRRPAASKEKV